MNGLIGGLTALVFLLVACGTNAEPLVPGTVGEADADGEEAVPTSLPAGSLDFETCEGFLDEPAPELVSKTDELTEPAKNENPAVEAMCQVSHQTQDGSKATTLAVTKFDSAGAADSHYDMVRGSLEVNDDVQLIEGVDGAQSFQAVANTAGVGSFVVIQKGLVVISLHTAMPSGETPLRDSGELLDFAKGVTAKLP